MPKDGTVDSIGYEYVPVGAQDLATEFQYSIPPSQAALANMAPAPIRVLTPTQTSPHSTARSDATLDGEYTPVGAQTLDREFHYAMPPDQLPAPNTPTPAVLRATSPHAAAAPSPLRRDGSMDASGAGIRVLAQSERPRIGAAQQPSSSPLVPRRRARVSPGALLLSAHNGGSLGADASDSSCASTLTAGSDTTAIGSGSVSRDGTLTGKEYIPVSAQERGHEFQYEMPPDQRPPPGDGPTQAWRDVASSTESASSWDASRSVTSGSTAYSWDYTLGPDGTMRSDYVPMTKQAQHEFVYDVPPDQICPPGATPVPMDRLEPPNSRPASTRSSSASSGALAALTAGMRGMRSGSGSSSNGVPPRPGTGHSLDDGLGSDAQSVPGTVATPMSPTESDGEGAEYVPTAEQDHTCEFAYVVPPDQLVPGDTPRCHTGSSVSSVDSAMTMPRQSWQDSGKVPYCGPLTRLPGRRRARDSLETQQRGALAATAAAATEQGEAYMGDCEWMDSEL